MTYFPVGAMSKLIVLFVILFTTSLYGQHVFVPVPTSTDNAAEIITNAIRSLPADGGTVELGAGEFDINSWTDLNGIYPTLYDLGGIIVDRSNVTLKGQGRNTLLKLGNTQNVNVIRIIGDVDWVTIRDLRVDANMANNNGIRGQAGGLGDDSTIPHDRFETCGIKAWRWHPRDPAQNPSSQDKIRHVFVKDVHVGQAKDLGVMLSGIEMNVLDSTFENCEADVVELLVGPGTINNCSLFVGANEVGNVGFGTDAAFDVNITNNRIVVDYNAFLLIGYRTWAGYGRHCIVGNSIIVRKSPGSDGLCRSGFDIRSTNDLVTANLILGCDFDQTDGTTTLPPAP